MKLSKEYIAGILDGEGSISIRKHRRDRKNPSYLISVRIYNSHEGLVDAINHEYSGKIYTRAPRPTNEIRSRKVQYTWETKGSMAKEMLTELLPFLIVKQHQAEL